MKKHIRNPVKRHGFCGFGSFPYTNPTYVEPSKATCKNCKAEYEHHRKDGLKKIKEIVAIGVLTEDEMMAAFQEAIIGQVMTA